MLITAIGAADKSREKKKIAKAGGAGFSELISAPESETSQAAGTASLGSASPLFFLQEVGDEEQQKKAAVKQGFDAIKYLDNIKMGLLCGNLSYAAISGLEDLLQEFRKNFTDPQLSNILDEIELRAKVELAKMNRNQ